MVQNKTNSVMQTIGGSIARHKTAASGVADSLNLNKYKEV